MQRHEQLLLENKAWAAEMLENDPQFFDRLSKGQKPDFLWIGCSDSRVAPDEITHARSGEIFIHRNIANMVVATDINLLSVLEYAVNVLQVKHVIVCGHYGCGGIQAAMQHTSFDVIEQWLEHIRKVYQQHKEELDRITDEPQRVNRLVEYNVETQLHHLAETPVIQDAWKRGKVPLLHGWVYDMASGIIKPLLELESPLLRQAKTA